MVRVSWSRAAAASECYPAEEGGGKVTSLGVAPHHASPKPAALFTSATTSAAAAATVNSRAPARIARTTASPTASAAAAALQRGDPRALSVSCVWDACVATVSQSSLTAHSPDTRPAGNCVPPPSCCVRQRRRLAVVARRRGTGRVHTRGDVICYGNTPTSATQRPQPPRALPPPARYYTTTGISEAGQEPEAIFEFSSNQKYNKNLQNYHI